LEWFDLKMQFNQLNLAAKVSIVLGSATAVFALGVAACSPIAPSVNKGLLKGNPVNNASGSNSNTGSTIDPSIFPNGLHMLFYRTQSGTNVLVGKEGYEWHFQNQPKNIKQEVDVSDGDSSDLLTTFKRSGDVKIAATPSNAWLVSGSGYVGDITFELNLTGSNSTLKPTQVEAITYQLIPPSAADVRAALQPTPPDPVYWRLLLSADISHDARQAFLDALDGIKLGIEYRDDTSTPTSGTVPAPAPSHDNSDAF
jgi:hypothetical protein